MNKLWTEGWFRTVVIGGAVALLAITYFAGQEREARAKAEGFAAGRQVEIDTATARMKQREMEFAAVSKQLTSERDAIHSQKQAVKVITKYLPATQGQVVEVAPAELPAAIRAKLPDAPGYTCMTEAAAVELGKATDDFQLCQKERTKLQADKTDLETNFKAAVAQRDEFHTALNGGTRAQRLRSAGKWLGIGAIVGGVAVEVLRGR